jgi:two-component system, OmpR family, response regulator
VTIPKLLIVDDDAEMRQMMAQYLQRSGFFVLMAATEAEMQAHLTSTRIDLILLDVMLGAENGVDICNKIRAEQDVPIILVSTLSADHHRMAGYEGGADDYIAKPFNPELLTARVRAVLRRGHRAASLSYRRNTALYQFGGWRYDGKKDLVTAPDGFQVALSRKETSLLKVLLANPHIPMTREEIADALDVTRDSATTLAPSESRAIDVLVGRLRAKIEARPKEPDMLRTERGVGYVFAVDVTVQDA